jgi:hypothetical protein
MRFAILGDHPDGWAVARAILATGRHRLVAHDGRRDEREVNALAPAARRLPDVEEILADPDVEAVIVASPFADRLNHLRRVLQSERSALCVHPVDDTPDGGHEINLLQGDMHQVVLPILPEAFHPACQDLRQRLGAPDLSDNRRHLIDLEVEGRGEPLFAAGKDAAKATFPGWALLRRLGGEIAEVQGLAEGEEVVPGEPVLLQGQFVSGGLFRVLYRPASDRERLQIQAFGPHGEARLDGPALTEPDADAWGAVAGQFEEAVARLADTPRAIPGAGRPPAESVALSWLDEVRCLELDDAARRSVERRRASSLDYQEASEEVGFKGTMTLVGCGMLWLILLLLIAATQFPSVGWLIIPVLVGFLGLQVLRWLVPGRPRDDSSDGPRTP